MVGRRIGGILVPEADMAVDAQYRFRTRRAGFPTAVCVRNHCLITLLACSALAWQTICFPEAPKDQPMNQEDS